MSQWFDVFIKAVEILTQWCSIGTWQDGLVVLQLDYINCVDTDKECQVRSRDYGWYEQVIVEW